MPETGAIHLINGGWVALFKHVIAFSFLITHVAQPLSAWYKQ